MCQRISEGLSGVGVPDPSGAIGGRGYNAFPVRAELRSVYPIVVHQRFRERFSRRCSPDPGSVILGGGYDPLAVWTKAYGGQALFMLQRPSKRLSCSGVPDPRAAVIRRRGDELSIRTEMCGPYGPVVLKRFAKRRADLDIEHSCGVIVGGCHDPLSVWTKLGHADPSTLSERLDEQLAGLRVPNPSNGVEQSDRQEASSVRTEPRDRHIAIVLKLLSERFSGLCIEDLGCMIIGSNRHAFAIGAELRRRRVLKLKEALASACVQNFRSSIFTERYDPSSVRTELRVCHAIVMFERLDKWVSVFGIPNSDIAIVCSRDDAIPVGTKLGCDDRALAFWQLQEQRAGLRVPQSGHAVSGNGDNALSIGAEMRREHPVVVFQWSS